MDARRWREDFPILDQEVNGHPLVYLDNAATAQKPRAVIDAIARYYERDNANVHRGIHALSNRATEGYEEARKRAAAYLGAASAKEIVFTRGTTEAINLVANAWGNTHVGDGDAIVLTELEHHSNIVPWQMLAKRTGAELRYIPVTGDDGLLDVSGLDALLDGAKLLAVTHISNTMGTVNPIAELCAAARSRGVTTLVDAAQSAGHRPLNVREINCDFLALSGHKICGPTGIGVLYGHSDVLATMPPWQGGGEMISRVSFYESTWNSVPHCFEAGTPDISGAIGLHAAMDYVDVVGRDDIREHDRALAAYAIERLSEIDGIRLFGPDPRAGHDRAGVVSFALRDAHAHDVVMLADAEGVALRGGHHCNQPLMERLGVPATARASFHFYNTREEIDRLFEVVAGIARFFRR